MKYDIPEIVEQIYNYVVVIPDKKDWPEYLGDSEIVGRSLYSFYYGLRIGASLSSALRGEDFTPAEGSAPRSPDD